MDVENAIVSQIYISNFFTLASFVILYYDYLLTLDDEVRFFWGRKWSSVTFLFFFNRYFPLAGHIPGVVKVLGSWSTNARVTVYSTDRLCLAATDVFRLCRCRAVQLYHQIFLVADQSSVVAIMTIRLHAMYGRSRRILAMMLVFWVSGIGVAAWALSGPTSAPGVPPDELPAGSCQSPLNRHAGVLLATPWEVVIVFDTIVFALTLYKAVEAWRMGPSVLFQVLVRDGTIYYLVIVLANLSNILSLTLSTMPSLLRGLTTTFANVTSVVMVSRLMLNIQNPALFGNYYYSPAARRTWRGGLEHASDPEDASHLGTFVAITGTGTGRRRRRFSSMAFWPPPGGRHLTRTQDAEADVNADGASFLGDPAWHRETVTQVAASQRTTETTDTTDSDVELERVL